MKTPLSILFSFLLLGAISTALADSAIPNRIYRDDPHYNWENYWRIDTMTVPAAPPQFPQSSSRNR